MATPRPWMWMFAFLALKSGNLLYTSAATSAVNRCDVELISNIKSLWESTGTPTNIIQTIKTLSPENVMLTTDRYFLNQEDLSCMYTIFADNGYNLVTFLKNSSVSGQFINEQEEVGYLINPETQDKRIAVILNDRGVTTWYRCNDNGVEGSPQCGILVSRGFSPDAVRRAIRVLKTFGVEITFELELCCNPCYH